MNMLVFTDLRLICDRLGYCLLTNGHLHLTNVFRRNSLSQKNDLHLRNDFRQNSLTSRVTPPTEAALRHLESVCWNLTDSKYGCLQFASFQTCHVYRKFC